MILAILALQIISALLNASNLFSMLQSAMNGAPVRLFDLLIIIGLLAGTIATLVSAVQVKSNYKQAKSTYYVGFAATVLAGVLALVAYNSLWPMQFVLPVIILILFLVKK